MRNNHKILIIVAAIVLVVVITIIGITFLINKSANDAVEKPITNNPGYYVEEGAESYATITKLAVENYLNQDISEPLSDRNERLISYFSPDSPTLTRDIDIRSTNEAVKTKASVTSVSFSDGQGIYPSLIVKADLTSYAGSDSNTVSKTYWIMLKKNNNNYTVYDVGLVGE